MVVFEDVPKVLLSPLWRELMQIEEGKSWYEKYDDITIYSARCLDDDDGWDPQNYDDDVETKEPTSTDDAEPTSTDDAEPTSTDDAEPTSTDDAEPTSTDDAEPTSTDDAPSSSSTATKNDRATPKNYDVPSPGKLNRTKTGIYAALAVLFLGLVVCLSYNRTKLFAHKTDRNLEYEELGSVVGADVQNVVRGDVEELPRSRPPATVATAQQEAPRRAMPSSSHAHPCPATAPASCCTRWSRGPR